MVLHYSLSSSRLLAFLSCMCSSLILLTLFYQGDMNVSTSQLVINIFYYNVEVISNETQIILEWTIGSEKKTQLIQVNSIMRVRNELKTSVPQPPGVIFRAYSFDDKSQLIINNDDADTEVMPSTSRDEFTVLQVTRTKGVLFVLIVKGSHAS